MKNTGKTFLFLFFVILPWAAQAQFFQCKDASGRTLSSDRPIPECADRPVRELGRNGMVKREVPAPLTAEEKQQKKLEEEKRKAELQAIEEKRKSDRLILERYGNEKGIEAARKRALDMTQDIIKRETATVAAAEKQLAQARVAMAPYKAKPASAPAELRSKVQEAEQVIREGGKIIEDRKAEMVQINARYDETLSRYREITGDAQPVAEAPRKAP
jgi:hypothetical protein